ncbi:FISUMP domain-containing protein [Fibrobacter sp. UWB7]|uniref:FISUMP domain-containing protein n=1 Tax=Fibrobacter sp. UWB7 TaxID=1896206 RepID=UPI000920554B|nr:FISUMP domain-containing protein [Fibrobacter sp. UWB7]SHM87098.1 major paralogous domain-containing protein [Fibrobacter sp. UWB7]
MNKSTIGRFWFNGMFAVISASTFFACDSSSSSVSDPGDGITINPLEVETGSITDNRDGETYRIVTIGEQTWMAENLKYNYSDTDASSYCYKDKDSNCDKYGRLYTWSEDMARNICPSGWHLPDHEDWKILINSTGGVDYAGHKLKAKSTWNSDGNGSDAYSFTALAAGFRNTSKNYEEQGSYASFWSATRYDYSDVLYWSLNADNKLVIRDAGNRNNAFSIRCIKGSKTFYYSSMRSSSSSAKSSSSVQSSSSAISSSSVQSSSSAKSSSSSTPSSSSAISSSSVQSSSSSEISSSSVQSSSSATSNSSNYKYDPAKVIHGTLTDSRDGQEYKTITIGNQTWMAENLRYEIPRDTADTVDVFCPQDPDTLALVGCYYTWNAAMKACPEGWQLPNQSNWKTLVNQISWTAPWGILETACNTNSLTYNSIQGNDVYGLNIIPSGTCNSITKKIIFGGSAEFWTSTALNEFFHGIAVFSFINDNLKTDSYTEHSAFKSVRCLKN